MSRIEVLFFELLQVSIGNRRRLSEVPSAADWQLLFEMAKRQALTAVAFRGVSLMKEVESESDGFGRGLGMNEMTYLKWLGLTVKVAQMNKRLNLDCIDVISFFSNIKIEACILKGQGVLHYYPHDLRECRNPGDIDVWLNADKKTIFRIGKSIDKDVKGVYHHLEMDVTCKDVNGIVKILKDNSSSSFPLELHYRPAFFANPFIDRRFNRWIKNQKGDVFRNIRLSTNSPWID